MCIRDSPKIERPYKVWLYPVSIIFTAIVFLALFVNSAIENPILGSIGFTVPALGAIVYWIFDRKLKKEAGENKEAKDVYKRQVQGGRHIRYHRHGVHRHLEQRQNDHREDKGCDFRGFQQ